MKTLLEENHDLPLVRVQVALATGAADEPEDRDGLTNFATELLARGAAGKTRAQLDAAFDALGAGLEIVTDLDGAYFELTVLKSKLDAALALLGGVLARPDFPPDEADKLKREIKAQLDEMRDDDGSLARRFFQRAMFGAHPYGRTVVGTERSLDALTLDEARAWHARAVRRGNLLIGFAGDLDQREADAAVQRHFAAIPDGGAPAVHYPPPPPVRGSRLTIVDKPDRTQSQILFGQPAPAWGEPDFWPLHVAVTAFGGTFTARLMNEVRSKRGLSYGASARIGRGRGRKALVAHVFPSLEQTAETLDLVLGLWRDWVEGGITAEELAFAQGYLASSFAFNLATPEDRLELRAAVEIAGLDGNYAAEYPERVRAVTLDDTRRVMRQHLSPRELEICIVSTAAELRPLLEAAQLTEGHRVEVVPFDSF
ncbi:MAG TPA: pitrilysin family protein [Polyangia bacterium]|nr:pitrilysin family protein [Polyangia bacterium]